MRKIQDEKKRKKKIMIAIFIISVFIISVLAMFIVANNDYSSLEKQFNVSKDCVLKQSWVANGTNGTRTQQEIIDFCQEFYPINESK